MKKLLTAIVSLLLCGCVLAACGGAPASGASAAEPEHEPVAILVAAAASLEYAFKDALIPLFQDKYPQLTVEGTYDSSGKLQAQIEAGLEADVFMSAASKQMNALDEAGLIQAGSIVPLLENQIVLIAPASSGTAISRFEQITEAQQVALGDPESVPAGQYAKEALTSLGLWQAVEAKASYGTNVTEVLGWVAAGSADVGIVYATDAATTDEVRVLAAAPEGSLASKIIYPVGIVATTRHADAAQMFVDFLQSPEALAVFEQYGFTPNV